jgi:hypothetical protein
MAVKALINALEDKLKGLDPDSKEAIRVAVKLDVMWMCLIGVLAICIKAVAFLFPCN